MGGVSKIKVSGNNSGQGWPDEAQDALQHEPHLGHGQDAAPLPKV